jgi:hypothetical protein
MAALRVIGVPDNWNSRKENETKMAGISRNAGKDKDGGGSQKSRDYHKESPSKVPQTRGCQALKNAEKRRIQ